MPLSSWSHIKGLPRRPVIGSCMMERQRPWETFNRHTSAGTFLVFYLNGVKHLHKWEASQYIDLTKKVVFFSPPFCFKGEKKFNLIFKPFLYILWDMFRDMDRSQTRPHSPQNSNILDPPPAIRNKENHKRPALPDLLNTRNIIFVFFSPLLFFFFIKDSIRLSNGVFRLQTATSRSRSSKLNAFMDFFFLNKSDVLLFF